MQAFSHHGVNSAIEHLLFIRILAGGAKGEMQAASTLALTGAGGGHYDAPDGAREASLVEHRAHFLLRSIRIAQLAGMENVEIDGDVVVCRDFRDHWKQRPRRVRRAWSAVANRPEIRLNSGCGHSISARTLS